MTLPLYCSLLRACNVLTNAMRSANVVTCAAVEIPPSSSLGNPGGSSSLIELAISRTIRFVSFCEPVAAIASTQASSVGVTIRYRTSCLVLHVPVMYPYMVYYYYVTVLHLSGYSVNSHFSISIRVRVRVYVRVYCYHAHA